MKKIIQAVFLFVLALIFGGLEGNAQNVTKIEANVPFEFVAGDRYLAAGAYFIRVLNLPAGAKQIEFRRASGESIGIMLAVGNGDSGKGRSELVFDRSSGTAILTKILTKDTGYSIPTVDISKLSGSVN